MKFLVHGLKQLSDDVDIIDINIIEAPTKDQAAYEAYNELAYYRFNIFDAEQTIYILNGLLKEFKKGDKKYVK